ncbi:MobA/MobL family protein [Blautia producta]
MSKLTNLKGRIDYISSHARQENLYAVYKTAERKFWRELAQCNQEEFKKSGTAGKCIEAREFIIALPESFVEYEPEMLLKLFTEHFKQKYGTECFAALHHNKRKTNYHIHLIFSERRLLEEPVEKITARNMFYDENGKHVRTKKEITDETGQVRKDCKIISKGEVYERKIFTAKDSRFKDEAFVNEVKCSFTELINIYVKEDAERLQVFNKHGVYLPMKKIGKNNPKSVQIVEDNALRQKWNQTVDRALISGIAEEKVMSIKQTEITDKVKVSFKKQGKQPELFMAIVKLAIVALQILISQLFNYMYRAPNGNVTSAAGGSDKIDDVKGNLPMPPAKSLLVKEYPQLEVICRKLNNHNHAIYSKEQQLSEKKKELEKSKGVFKGKQRKNIQQDISGISSEIDDMKQRLTGIMNDYGYKNAKEFLAKYKAARVEYSKYQKMVTEWKSHTEEKAEPTSVLAKLEIHKRNVAKRNNKHRHSRAKDRDAR